MIDEVNAVDVTQIIFLPNRMVTFADIANVHCTVYLVDGYGPIAWVNPSLRVRTGDLVSGFNHLVWWSFFSTRAKRMPRVM